MEVTIHTGDDAFTVRYDPDLASVDAIKRSIRTLGYRPVEMDAKDLGKAAATTPRQGLETAEVLPGIVAEAVRKGGASGKLVLIDFYAAWCAPCRKLEKDMQQPGLRESLEKFVVLKVDTDKDTAVAKYFGVTALPTLIVLDAAGRERFKRVGIIRPADLERALNDLSAKEGTTADGGQRAPR